MRKRAKRNILLVMVVIAIAIIGYCTWNKPHLNVESTNGIKITALNLYSSLSKNDSVAKSIYLNKVLEVSGKIANVSFNQQHQQIILLKTNIADGSVNCTMEEKIDDARQGETIVLKGICSGYIAGDMGMGLPGDVFLIRCYPSN